MNPTKIRESVNQLLDIKNIQSLNKLIHFGNNKAIRYQPGLPKNKGLYAFWLNNSTRIAKDLHRKVAIKGPREIPEHIEWNWNLEADHILLYVGKSINMKNRTSLHLKLGTEKWDQTSDNTLNKETTSCQMRAGIEHLIQGTEFDYFEFLHQFIGMSLIKVPDFQNRFFSEDLAIGEGKPWFNIDSER